MLSDSEASPLEGSYSSLFLVEILSLNFDLFQSYDPVSNIQDTTHRVFKGDVKNSKNDIEYVVLAIRPWNFAEVIT